MKQILMIGFLEDKNKRKVKNDNSNTKGRSEFPLLEHAFTNGFDKLILLVINAILMSGFLECTSSLIGYLKEHTQRNSLLNNLILNCLPLIS